MRVPAKRSVYADSSQPQPQHFTRRDPELHLHINTVLVLFGAVVDLTPSELLSGLTVAKDELVGLSPRAASEAELMRRSHPQARRRRRNGMRRDTLLVDLVGRLANQLDDVRLASVELAVSSGRPSWNIWGDKTLSITLQDTELWDTYGRTRFRCLRRGF